MDVTEEPTQPPTQKSQRSYQHKNITQSYPLTCLFSNFNSLRRAFNSGPASLLENGFSKDASSHIWNRNVVHEQLLQRNGRKQEKTDSSNGISKQEHKQPIFHFQTPAAWSFTYTEIPVE